MRKTKTRKSTFRSSDVHRALLTDTLPYEVPVLFSNSGFYLRIQNKCHARIELATGLNFFFNHPFTIPYSFGVRKNSHEDRRLSISHPGSQVQWAKFIHQNAQLIIGLCNKSTFSLRHPAKVASRYYEKSVALRQKAEFGDVEVESTGLAKPQEQASSFFAYQRYNLIYKFYDSTEFHDLESEFQLLRKLDISKCFPHIYTHSISWAVRSKNFIKNNLSAVTFDTTFDRLMRHANYDETNGIVVGPEVSRIFAEIILQRVDQETKNELEEAWHLKDGKDYAVRRYVDDFFVFARTETSLDTIQRVLAKNLEEYKLYLNGAKTETSHRPFISGQTAAKVRLAELLDNFFEKHTVSYKQRREELSSLQDATNGPISLKTFDPTPVSYVRNSTQLADSYIRDIKSTILLHDSDYEAVSNHLFTVLRKRTINFLGDLPKNTILINIEKIVALMSVIIDIAFFVFSMSPRARITYQLAQICLAIKKLTFSIGGELQDCIGGRVANHLKRTIELLAKNSRSQNVEFLNLLIVLREYGQAHRISEKTLLEFFNLTPISSDDKMRFPGYFQALTLLHYIGDDPNYSQLKNGLSGAIINIVDSAELRAIYRNSEYTMLVLDCLACPFLPNDFKRQLGISIINKSGVDDAEEKTTKLIALANEGDWFFSWRDAMNVENLFWKKELKPAY